MTDDHRVGENTGRVNWSCPRPSGVAVSSVDGQAIMVKYKDGEKKIVVGPNVPIVRFEISNKSEIKPGAAINVAAAKKLPDGTFEVARINVGRNGVTP
jgi:hypothetical protein